MNEKFWVEEFSFYFTDNQTIPVRDTVRYGFTAWKNENQAYEIGDVITFENLISDYGSAYDPVTSYFTCPITGPYLVSAQLKRYEINISV